MPDEATPEVLSEDWCTHRFDHLAPELADNLHETLSTMRGACPVAHSSEHGGFWIITKHADVVRVAQDWESFSSEHGITVPGGSSPIPAIPEQVDPPLHREYKRLINAFFTPQAVLEHEAATRDLVNGLIDEFIESGTCDFMEDFARPLPGLVFFERFLHAPAAELAEVNRLATVASVPTSPEGREARGAMLRWIGQFAEQRRAQEPRGDVVDAILGAEIEGRPITDLEVVGMLQLLLFGGLDTTAGALGQMMIRLCTDPEILALIRDQPDRVPEAVEELLRLDGPFIFIGRTAMRDVEIGDATIKEGDRVLLSWVSANRDDDEFDGPDGFDLDRTSNRHVAFGAGPHRCAGSHLARMNLRIALTEVLRRLRDLRLVDAAAPIEFHSMYNRAPVRVPIAFASGPREA